MSWLFSRALVAEYSAGSCSDGGLSVQSSVMPTLHPFLRRGKTTDASTLSRSGQTYAVLTADRGEELLTWFREGSRARTLARPERVRASAARARDSGPSSLESLARFDPSSHGWKTAQPCLLGDSESFSPIWPRSGSMRNGVCSERRASDSPIAATACGSSLPTPSGVNGGNNNTMGRVDEWGGQLEPFAWDRHWLDVFTRVRGNGDGMAYRLDRTDAIRNGQVPRVAARAWIDLHSRIRTG